MGLEGKNVLLEAMLKKMSISKRWSWVHMGSTYYSISFPVAMLKNMSLTRCPTVKMASLRLTKIGDVGENDDFQSPQLRSKIAVKLKNCSQLVTWGSI